MPVNSERGETAFGNDAHDWPGVRNDSRRPAGIMIRAQYSPPGKNLSHIP